MIKFTSYPQAFAALGLYLFITAILNINTSAAGLGLIGLGIYQFYATWHDDKKRRKKK